MHISTYLFQYLECKLGRKSKISVTVKLLSIICVITSVIILELCFNLVLNDSISLGTVDKRLPTKKKTKHNKPQF